MTQSSVVYFHRTWENFRDNKNNISKNYKVFLLETLFFFAKKVPQSVQSL